MSSSTPENGRARLDQQRHTKALWVGSLAIQTHACFPFSGDVSPPKKEASMGLASETNGWVGIEYLSLGPMLMDTV